MKERGIIVVLCIAFTLVIMVSQWGWVWAQHGEMGEHKKETHSQTENNLHKAMSEEESRKVGMQMPHKGVGMYPPVPWTDPKISISPPPPLMGKQMGKVHTLNVSPLGYEMDGEVKVFTLIAQPVKRFLVRGTLPEDEAILNAWKRFLSDMLPHIQHMTVAKEVKLWGYNGSMPGPTIEVTEGDRIRVIVKNELPEPTSIHWHGLEVPNDQDGAGGETQVPIPPGGTGVYEFTVHQVGTYMYHSGFNVMKQDGMGLGGFVVIHPKSFKHKIDKDVAIMLQEFSFLPGNDRPNLVTMEFNWFTFNGKSAPDIEVIRVNQDERVRIRFGNLSMDSHPIHVHGYTWKVVGTEGGPIPEQAQWPGATINVPPGTTRDVEFVAWNPGIWRFHCHKLHHIINAHAEVPMGIMPHGGMFTFVHVIPKDE